MHLPTASPLVSENPFKPRGVVSVGGLGSLKSWEKEIRLVCGDDTVPKLAPGDTDARFADTSPDLLLPTGVPAVMLHGVFDFALHMPANAMWFATLAGVMLHPGAGVEPANGAWHDEQSRRQRQ